jgi:DNA-binding LacI/PurR family transcriptional regulator
VQGQIPELAGGQLDPLELHKPARRLLDAHRQPAGRADIDTLREWTAGPDPVTAICCFNDLFAGFAIAAARSAGLKVPQDLSVIGVDDEPMGGFLQPTLTTVRFSFESTAAYTAAWLRAALNGKPAPRLASGENIRLIERESVAPLRP